MNCEFCDLLKKHEDIFILWENSKFALFLDNHPIHEGHVLLVPKNHIEDIFDLNDIEYKKMMLLVKYISLILKKEFKVPRVGVVVEGYGVDHSHIHIVPISHQGELDPDNAKFSTPEQLEIVFKKLKNSFLTI